MVENALLLRTSRSGRIYVGCESLSNLRPIIDRYMRIADISQNVFIFGEEDWTLPRHPNMRVIPLLPDSKLARESFLIADSPTLECALVARQEDAQEPQAFRVLKTSNAKVVRRLASAIEGVIDWSLAVSI
jgi:DICT domain-containing protein